MSARVGAVLVAVALLSAIGAGPVARAARAAVPIEEISALPSTSQAGGHPNISIAARFGNRESEEFPGECFCEDPKDVSFSLPAGVVGNPQATPQCSSVNFGSSECQPSTQVGVASVNIRGSSLHMAIYNLDPGSGHAGLLGLFAPLANSPLFVVVSARTGGDYGLDATLYGLEHEFPPTGVSLTLWGVPADPANDSERAPIGKANCSGGPWPCFEPQASNGEVIPFLDNPTSCDDASPSVRLEILAYDGETTEAEAPWPATTGCDQLTFNPSLTVAPTTTATDTPSGLDVDVSIPQPGGGPSPSPSELRTFTLSLPDGLSIDPGALDGKAICPEASARFGTDEAAQCPEDSTVGTLSLTNAVLPAALPGHVYLGRRLPGEGYRLILAADGFDTHVKLAGTVEPDAGTGRLTVSLQGLPQSPFSDFQIHFFGSEGGILATPTQCGSYPVNAAFVPWDGALSQQTSSQSFELDEGPGTSACPGPVRPFLPGFEAGVLDATAGAHSPFFFELTRPDGSQGLAGLTVKAPPGLTATLRGVPYCPEADIDVSEAASEQAPETPSCPAASQIGIATILAGAGGHPVSLVGKTYLSGPYKGAPLSLAAVVPVVSGPYDWGAVAIRAALRVDPRTARITAVSDPLPVILQGIPLRLRSVMVELDRGGFISNPTDCSPFSVQAEVQGDQGALANPSRHFQVANCRGLGFAPKLTLGLSGGTRRAAHPALRAVLTRAGGNESNLSRLAVALPHSLLLNDLSGRTPCTKPKLLARECSVSSVVGFAKMETPMLEAPLTGSIYLASGRGHKLPDLVADLDGQFRILLDGRVDTDAAGGLRASFTGVPDAPFSRFTLSLKGGRSGLLVAGTDLCAPAGPVAVAASTGQNGKQLKEKVRARVAC